jgi:hypothetical protein
MAMTTKAKTNQASLKRRIRQFYVLLNDRDFARCYQMIDPRLREQPNSVTRYQYAMALQEFLDAVGSVSLVVINVSLHENEPSVLYGGRDFAIGQTKWKDRAGEQHIFSERWVREGRLWYSRCAGLLIPTTESPGAGGRVAPQVSARGKGKRNGKTRTKGRFRRQRCCDPSRVGQTCNLPDRGCSLRSTPG